MPFAAGSGIRCWTVQQSYSAYRRICLTHQPQPPDNFHPPCWETQFNSLGGRVAAKEMTQLQASLTSQYSFQMVMGEGERQGCSGAWVPSHGGVLTVEGSHQRACSFWPHQEARHTHGTPALGLPAAPGDLVINENSKP